MMPSICFDYLFLPCVVGGWPCDIKIALCPNTHSQWKPCMPAWRLCRIWLGSRPNEHPPPTFGSVLCIVYTQ